MLTGQQPDSADLNYPEKTNKIKNFKRVYCDAIYFVKFGTKFNHKWVMLDFFS